MTKIYLEQLMASKDITLKTVAKVILEKLNFYDDCLKSWDKIEKFTPEEIEIGKKCCNAGIDMVDSIVNELRILYLS
jgi:uncharacterized protein YutE (UPF0331/DUF86 family)